MNRLTLVVTACSVIGLATSSAIAQDVCSFGRPVDYWVGRLGSMNRDVRLRAMQALEGCLRFAAVTALGCLGKAAAAALPALGRLQEGDNSREGGLLAWTLPLAPETDSYVIEARGRDRVGNIGAISSRMFSFLRRPAVSEKRQGSPEL